MGNFIQTNILFDWQIQKFNIIHKKETNTNEESDNLWKFRTRGYFIHWWINQDSLQEQGEEDSNDEDHRYSWSKQTKTLICE